MGLSLWGKRNVKATTATWTNKYRRLTFAGGLVVLSGRRYWKRLANPRRGWPHH